jgi:hypothetical protein
MMLLKVGHETTSEQTEERKRRRKEDKTRIDNSDNGLMLSDYAAVGQIPQSSLQRLANSARNATSVMT